MLGANTAALTASKPEATGFKVLGAVSFSHFLNDMLQSLLLAVYPMLKGEFSLTFTQIGLITLLYQCSASLLQPLIGAYTDRRPQPYALPVGMLLSMSGIALVAFAPNYGLVLLAAMLLGTGSSIFHPESSRVVRLVAGGRHGLAQSVFQVGGSAGSAMGPLLAAWVIESHGQRSVSWFLPFALLAMAVLSQVGLWYKRQHLGGPRKAKAAPQPSPVGSRRATLAIVVLLALLFSKYLYMTSIQSYFTFYLIHKFGVPVSKAQLYLFGFLFAVALGTVLGGPIGDRIGRKKVIWGSILGAAPFALALPYVDLAWTCALSFAIGLIMASAFAAMLVFAQELLPGRVGMVSGLFYGLAFGIAGLGAAVLGVVADVRGIDFVYTICSFLPLLGLLTAFLPDLGKPRALARG